MLFFVFLENRHFVLLENHFAFWGNPDFVFLENCVFFFRTPTTTTLLGCIFVRNLCLEMMRMRNLIVAPEYVIGITQKWFSRRSKAGIGSFQTVPGTTLYDQYEPNWAPFTIQLHQHFQTLIPTMFVKKMQPWHKVQGIPRLEGFLGGCCPKAWPSWAFNIHGASKVGIRKK